jgi:predicted NBD/HSP70 family sugar kinase
MNSVGIDLHRKRSFVAVIDDQGEVALSRRIVNDRDTFWRRAVAKARDPRWR